MCAKVWLTALRIPSVSKLPSSAACEAPNSLYKSRRVLFGLVRTSRTVPPKMMYRSAVRSSSITSLYSSLPHTWSSRMLQVLTQQTFTMLQCKNTSQATTPQATTPQQTHKRGLYVYEHHLVSTANG